MLVIFEGHLSYEVPLVDVLRQVLTTDIAGAAVLQLADPMTGARGDILIENCKTLVGAQMYEPKAMGYPALRKLCEFSLADYRLVQPDAAKANRGDHSLNLEIEKIIQLIPHLPEDPSSIGADPLERIFSNNGAESGSRPVEPDMARLDAAHATGGFEAVSVEMIQAARAENWRPLAGSKESGKSTNKPRSEFQTLSDRIMEELSGSEPSQAEHDEENGQRSKIKYRASNPFRSPKDFLLTILSLFKLLLPRVILPVLALVFLYQGGTYIYKNYKPQISSMQQGHHQPAAVPTKNNVFLRAKPHVNTASVSAPPATSSAPEATAAHHVEPVRTAAKPVASRPVAPRHEIKHVERPAHAASAHAKPAAEAAPKPPVNNEPIPEYKGPSSSTGEAPKHRHAYQTLPTQ